VIPEEAIVPQAGRQFVYKLVDGPDQDTRIAQRVEVKVGTRQAGKVEILSGLQGGEVVVTAGQQRIQKDGTPVRVLDVPRPAAAAGGGPAGGGLSTRSAGAMAEVVPNAGGNPCAVASGVPRAAGRRG
jgi:membrane fusion protein (multidrug efflux system)